MSEFEKPSVKTFEASSARELDAKINEWFEQMNKHSTMKVFTTKLAVMRAFPCMWKKEYVCTLFYRRFRRDHR